MTNTETTDVIMERMTINPAKEYLKSSTYILKINKKINLEFPSTEQIIDITVQARILRQFPQDITCAETQMLNYFDLNTP